MRLLVVPRSIPKIGAIVNKTLRGLQGFQSALDIAEQSSQIRDFGKDSFQLGDQILMRVAIAVAGLVERRIPVRKVANELPTQLIDAGCNLGPALFDFAAQLGDCVATRIAQVGKLLLDFK